MISEQKDDIRALEHEKNHLLQVISLFTFFAILISDFFLLRVAAGFSSFVPLFIRIALFIIVFALGLALNWMSHQALFGEGEGCHDKHEPPALVTDGVFSHVRHPMYLSILLIYLAFILLTVSLVSLIPWVISIIIYNYLANYEESELERIFGKDYLEYKKKVSKWIPRVA
ncbi:MAG: methyltransferase family protein [Candidatus Hodarchaeota archaeon]